MEEVKKSIWGKHNAVVILNGLSRGVIFVRIGAALRRSECHITAFWELEEPDAKYLECV